MESSSNDRWSLFDALRFAQEWPCHDVGGHGEADAGAMLEPLGATAGIGAVRGGPHGGSERSAA